MNILEVQQVLENKLRLLNERRVSMVIAGLLNDIVAIDKEIEETRLTLNTIVPETGNNLILNSANSASHVVSYNYGELDKACSFFRDSCYSIQILLPPTFELRLMRDGSKKFTGGYDEIQMLFGVLELNEQILLAIMALDLANNICNHEANKVEMNAPKWWHYCWGV